MKIRSTQETALVKKEAYAELQKNIEQASGECPLCLKENAMEASVSFVQHPRKTGVILLVLDCTCPHCSRGTNIAFFLQQKISSYSISAFLHMQMKDTYGKD